MARDPKPASAPVLDLAAERLLVGGAAVDLRPKTWAVLRLLVDRAGDLVTKDDILDHVWEGVAVSEGTLSKSIGELRVALDDDIQKPRFLQTVSRRGFRWIGPVEIRRRGVAEVAASVAKPAGSVAKPAGSVAAVAASAQEPGSDAPAIVARQAELEMLRSAFARASRGERQFVFVTGEAGVGKSTLVEGFLASLAGSGTAIAHGQCLESAGRHEAFLPFYEAFERLAREDEDVAAAFRRLAPTWSAQMPAIGDGVAAAGSSGGRLLREIGQAIAEIASRRTLVLVLEDLHWADRATTDLCAALARARDAARVLVVATLRDAESLALEHPSSGMLRELTARGLAEWVRLSPFLEDEVESYAASRFPGLGPGSELAARLVVQTGGNPLFVRLVMDEWAHRGDIAPGDDGRWSIRSDVDGMVRTVPDSMRAFLDHRLAQLEAAEREIVEAASVRIGDFGAGAIADALGRDVEDTEVLCRRIARRGQLLRLASSPQAGAGRDADRFGFVHATVQAVVLDGLPASRRRRLHLAAAAQIEREYTGRTTAVASQLAVHLEGANEPVRAAHYLREAADNAMRRESPRDAVPALEHALELLEHARPGDERNAERMLVLASLGVALQTLHGVFDPGVMKLMSEAGELAVSREDLRRFGATFMTRIQGVCIGARYGEADAAVREAFSYPERVADPDYVRMISYSAAQYRYRLGHCSEADAFFRTALGLEGVLDAMPGLHPQAFTRSAYAALLALTGNSGDARRMAREAIEHGRAHSRLSECSALTLTCWALAILHDFGEAEAMALRALDLARTDGFPAWISRPEFVVGLAGIHSGRIDEGIRLARHAIEERERLDHRIDHSALHAMLAEALLLAGRDGAEALLDKGFAFAEETGERFFESELLRLRAAARRARGAGPGELEADLRRAYDLAAGRGIFWHAHLAARDLGRLLDGTGRAGEAEALVDEALRRIDGAASPAAPALGSTA